jgi:uroporphyrinogen-III synthase
VSPGPRPLAGRRVLVTRPASQAAPLVRHLRELGAEVLEVPVITVEPLAGAAEMRAAARRLREGRAPRWLAVTSANAAEPLGTLEIPADLEGVVVAAVGEATAEALRRIGLSVELVGEGGGAGSLADRLIAAGAGGGVVWLPQARGARPELAERLRRAGAEVHVTACYRTITLPGLAATLQTAASGGLDAVTLLSPSAVEAVVEALGRAALSGPILLCGGATTAAALRRHGLSAVVAGGPDPAAVGAALTAALRR